MAKIRTIKPAFWEDEKIAALPFEARLLYIGTWNYADDIGVLRGSCTFLRTHIFPYDDITVADVRQWVSLLIRAGFLASVSYEDEDYLVILRFNKHQNINRPSAPAFMPLDVLVSLLPAGSGYYLPKRGTRKDGSTGEDSAATVRERCQNTVEAVSKQCNDSAGREGNGKGMEMEREMGDKNTHTLPVDTMKGGSGENALEADAGAADAAGGVEAPDAVDEDDDWYGVVEVSPSQPAPTAGRDEFAQRAAEICRLIGERYPQIAAMREPLRDDQLRWIAERYAMEDVRRILSDMDDKRVYDPHSRSYRAKTFNAFMAFADCDRMVGRAGSGRRTDAAAGVRPSKRLYTYEEMCDEIPARARQEDFTMIVINGRKMWQKRAMA